MNYYPYFNSVPYVNVPIVKEGLFKRLFSGINFSSILNGTQKTLNIVNQTIPLIKQAKPVLANAKTMFKIMNEFKKVDMPNTKIIDSETMQINNSKQINNNVNNMPTFFQ